MTAPTARDRALAAALAVLRKHFGEVLVLSEYPHATPRRGRPVQGRLL